jgi:ribosomal protein S27AE
MTRRRQALALGFPEEQMGAMRMMHHVIYVKLTSGDEWKRVPVALPGGARTIAAGNGCLTVKAVLLTLGYADAIVKPRDLNAKDDPLGNEAWVVNPAQKARCPQCGGIALIAQPDTRWRCLFCHFETDDTPEELAL